MNLEFAIRRNTGEWLKVVDGKVLIVEEVVYYKTGALNWLNVESSDTQSKTDIVYFDNELALMLRNELYSYGSNCTPQLHVKCGEEVTPCSVSFRGFRDTRSFIKVHLSRPIAPSVTAEQVGDTTAIDSDLVNSNQAKYYERFGK